MTDLDKGQIPPESSIKLNVDLITCCLKRFQIDLIIEIVSDTGAQHLVKIQGTSIGPIVEISHKEIDFGDVEVLKKCVKKIKITNKSIIEADFYAFTKTKNSVFKPVQKHHILQPEQAYDLDIICFPDDPQRFLDTLFVVIKEGMDREIKLKARGIGSTIVYKDLSIVDFATAFTHRTQMQEIFIENKGRRTQTLKWTRKVESKIKSDDRAIQGQSATQLTNPDGQHVFSINPENIVLPPKTGLMFQFKAFTSEVGKISEQFILSSAVGSERKTNNLCISTFQGEFIKPQLIFSEKHMNFQYIWEKGIETSIISQDLEITCASPLPVNFSLFTEPPFSVSPDNVSLLPGKNVVIQISFDPTLKKDQNSGKISEKLWIKHFKHPKNETFPLTAEYCYPNLEFNTTDIDFGAVMNDTIKKATISMKNISVMPASYCWYLAEQPNFSGENPQINDVFGILPLRGIISPNEDEKIEFTYFATSFQAFNLTAVCKVEGGPDYQISLRAEASDVDYRLIFPKKNKLIDVGETFLGTKVSNEFEIENTSKVTFDFHLKLDLSLPRAKLMADFIAFTPSKGSIAGSDRIKIRINLSTGFPGPFNQALILQIAHFEPERIVLKGFGLFPSLRFDAVRKTDRELLQMIKKVALRTENANPVSQEKLSEESIMFSPEKDEHNETFHLSDVTQKHAVKPVQNLYESMVNEMKDEVINELEKEIIKAYVKQNKIHISSMDKKSFRSSGKSQGKALSSTQALVDENSSKGRLTRGSFKFFEDIVLATYVLNLGTIIAGNKSAKNITVYNIGRCFTSFSIDMKNYKQMGLSISNTKVHKLPYTANNNSITIQVSLQTKKSTKSGRTSFLVPINIENGGKYMLEVIAFIRVPELNLSDTEVDFGSIQVGLAKQIYIRVENIKTIDCDWQVISALKTTAKVSKKKEEVVLPKFTVNPSHGQLAPGAKQVIEVLFEPLENKAYEEALTFIFKDSTRRIDLICRGEGIIPHIEFLPHNLALLPCMPREMIFRSFSIKNHSDFDIGIIWSDQDTITIQEERTISDMSSTFVRSDVRQLNDNFWPDLKEESEINANNKVVEKELAQLEKTESNNKEEMRNELFLKLRQKEKKPVYPQKIDFENQNNIILVSDFKDLPEKASAFVKEKLSNCPIDLTKLLEWHVEQETEIGKRIFQETESKKLELEALITDRNKKIRQKKPVPELDTKNFCNIDREDFRELIKQRIVSNDCNAGCLFINMDSTSLIDEVSAMDVITEILEGSNIYLVKVAQHKNEGMLSNEVLEAEVIPPINLNAEKEKIVEFMKKYFNELNYSNEQQELVFQKVEEYDALELIEKDENLYKIVEPIEKNQNLHEIALVYLENLTLLDYQLLAKLPKPQFPDPNSLPLPSPSDFQIIKKTTNPHKIVPIAKFQILTPKTDTLSDHEELTIQNYSKYYDENITRWTVKAKSTVNLQIKFMSDCLGEFSEVFTFENFSTVFNGMHKGFIYSLKASTQYPSISRNVVNIFPNRKKCRVKGQIPKKEFFVQENVFDFGPLLAFQNGQIEKSLIKKRHSTVFRLTNISPYPVELNFCLMSSIQDFSQCPSLKSTKSVFEVEPKEIVAQIGETVNVRVWGLPKEKGNAVDSLICLMKNNPSPFIVNLCCNGVLPDISLSSNEIVFDRILVNKKVTNSFEISNTTPLDVKWKIVNFKELLQNGFEISKEFSTLDIGQKQSIEVNFSSSRQEKKRCFIEIEAEDTQGLNIHMKETKKIALVAEAFQVNVSFTGFSNNEKMFLDFGKTMVDFPLEANVTIKNEGTYSLKYQLEVTKPVNVQFFQINPAALELNPGANQSINIKFLAQKDVVFDEKYRDVGLQLQLIERNDIFNQIPIAVKAEAQHSKISIEPSKYLNFGPVAFSESKTQYFEIVNNGQFEFAYELFDYENTNYQAEVSKRFSGIKQEQQFQRTRAKDQLIPPIKLPKLKAADKLSISQFTISPSVGIIPPGGSQKIEANFRGNGSTFFESKIAVMVSNNASQNTVLSSYLFQGESCIPTLETKNFRAIFEEQVVTQSLTSTGVNIQSVVNSNVFCIEENAFYFGNLIPTKNPQGMSEKIKIINTGKVFANVKFDVVSKNSSINGFDVTPKQARINPHESLYVKLIFKPEIMAHYEGSFIATIENGNPSCNDCKLNFDLKGDGTFPSIRALTENQNISVINGDTILDFGRIKLDKSKISMINLKNIGIIPATFQSTITTPNSLFRLVSAAERTLMPLEVYPFQIECNPKEIGSVEAKITFTTLMNPYEKSTITLKGEIVDELFSIEGIEGDGSIIDFGDLIFANNLVNPEQNSHPRSEKLSKRTFLIRNNSTETMRLEIVKPDDIKFLEIRPLKAHISPKMTKKFTIYFYKPPLLSNNQFLKELLIKSVLINPRIKKSPIQQLTNWDDTKVNKRMITEIEAQWLKDVDSMKKQFIEDKKINPRIKEPIYPICPIINDSLPLCVEIKEQILEPEFDLLSEKQSESRIKISARIDTPKISFENTTISFLPTKMFTSRVYTFKAFNNSAINVAFDWEFFNPITGSNDGGAFSITPLKGILAKNSFQEFILRFAPLDFDPNPQRVIFMKLVNFSSDNSSLKINLEAKIERPICHFELPFAVSESSEKVVEIESVGMNTKTVKKFYVLNPTSFGYEFAWISTSGQNSQLKCLTQKGVILPNKKFEMIFEFAPVQQTLETFDIKYIFSIPQLSVTENLVFRVKILQPKVFFMSSKIDFGPLLLSGKSKETIFIKNLDNIPYTFSFVKASLKNLGHEQGESLKVSQLTGTLLPCQDTPIILTFSPKLETEFNYNLQVNIPQKREPLTLNVKGQGYKLHHDLKLNNCILENNNLHQIDFGETFVYEIQKRSLQLTNSGDFNIDFILNKKPHSSVAIVPETGTVRKGESIFIDVIFQPNHTVTLNSSFQLQIVSGCSYDFELKGFSKLPLIEFNPKAIDFGEVILTKAGVTKVINLEIKNLDKKTLSLQTDFINNDSLEIQMPVELSLLPIESDKDNQLLIPFTFKPKRDGKFDYTIPFFINNRHKIDVPVKGEAISCLFSLLNPEDILTDFDIVPINTKQTRQIAIKNFSKIPIKLNFDINDQQSRLSLLGLSVQPTSVIIPKKASISLEVTFQPTQRQRQFSFPLKYEINDSREAEDLLTVSGACYSAEIKIIEESLIFNQVVLNSFLSKRLHVLNSGDLAADFYWDLPSFGPHFTISPKKGSIMPSEQLMFDVTFSPLALGDFKISTKLIISGTETPFVANFSGKGIQTPSTATEDIQIEANVRTKISKQIMIKNPTSTVWNLRPVLTTSLAEIQNYFSTLKSFEVPASGQSPLILEYFPLTLLPNPQNARIFIPLPDGTALSYHVEGKALPPKPEAAVNLTIKAKTHFNHSVLVSNWLDIDQRFVVIFEMNDGKTPISDGIIINSAKIVEVPAKVSQNFKFSLFVLKKGVFSMNLTLKNKTNNEFITYPIIFNVEETPTIASFHLSCPVRESRTQSISIENPLPVPVCLPLDKVIIEARDIFQKTKEPLMIPANSSRQFEFIFHPLLVYRNQKGTLRINSLELGQFAFELVLNSEKSTNLPTISFKSQLGSEQIKPFTFSNFLPKQALFICKIEKLLDGDTIASGPADFFCEQQTVSVSSAIESLSGTPGTVNIRFEPSSTGGSRALLTVSNAEGGDFSAYLIGTSSAPLPKGPFKIGPKGGFVEFKNPFFEAREFSFKFDNPAFSCTVKSPFRLDGKKVINLPVNFRSGAESGSTGRILVESGKDQIVWVMFLQGI